jgi:SAM-dependent methyltransferase
MSDYDSIARFYDADHASFDDDVAFYRELARRAGGRVLEAMCGSGRLLVPLAEAGLQVTGLDSSQAMLDLARERIASEDLSRTVKLRCADVRSPIEGGPYALAIVALNSFMHLATTADQLAALGSLHHSLRPGGLLAIDVFNPNPRLLAEYDNELVLDKLFDLADGTRVQKFVAQQIDAAAQLNYVTFIYDELSEQGHVRRHTAPLTLRWVYRYELEHLLARSGFALEQLYGSYELDPFRSDSDVMLAVARAETAARHSATG